MSTIPHEKTGYTGVLSQFSPNRFFELSGENTKAFRICLIKTRKNQKTSNINASRERWSADCCGKQNRYNHSKSAAGDSVPVRVRSPAPRAEDLRRRSSALFFERAKENPDIKIVVVWPGQYRSEAFLCDPTVALEKIR